MPANWAMPVWLSMILCGARAGGLRETRTINFESQRIPDLFPDSRAGSAHYAALRRDEEDRYFRFGNFLLFLENFRKAVRVQLVFIVGDLQTNA